MEQSRKTAASSVELTDHSATGMVTLPLSEEVPEHKVFPALAIPCGETRFPDFPSELYRLYYLEKGQLGAVINGQKTALSAGQLVALAPGEKLEAEGNAELRSVAFHHNFFCVHVRMDEFFCDGVVFNRAQQSPVCAVPDASRELIQNLFTEICQSVQASSLLTQSRTLSALHTILLQIAEFMLQNDPEQPVSQETVVRKSPLTQRFESILDIHYTIRHDVQFYADALCVTPSQLNRRLKKELGKSTSVLIQERIAIEARRKLSDGNTPVKEVAFMLGFKDQLYFSRFFRKHFGSSPSHYFNNVHQSDHEQP